MKIEQKIHERLVELVNTPPEISYKRINSETSTPLVSSEQAAKWGTSCLNILKIAFGVDSDHYIKFNERYKSYLGVTFVEEGLGIMKAALDDYSHGFTFDLKTAISGEIFQDFVELAKRALAEGNKDVAAVLACAALEDTLKRYARKQGLSVDDKEMSDVVGALKKHGSVSGAQKTLLDTMPKIRNYAMHANWSKINEPDVSSVIGFVEQFLIKHF